MDEYPKVYLYRRMVQAKRCIDDHYADALDIDDIAEEASFSKFHFIRLFRKIYGVTPHQYLTRVRVTQAKILLAQGMAIAETAVAVGFESPTSFAMLFKNLTGTSPTTYKLNSMARNRDIEKQPLHFIPHCFAEKRGWLKKSNFQDVAP